MASAISAQGRLHYMVFEGRIDRRVFIEYLTALLHDIEGKIFLVVDGSSVHAAKKTKEYVTKTEGRLTLFILPPYSPQLNPDEWVWNNSRTTSRPKRRHEPSPPPPTRPTPSKDSNPCPTSSADSSTTPNCTTSPQ